MTLTDISERISYLPASDNPLSADIVIIKGDLNYWIYDVGANEDAVSLINNLPGKKSIVLSHFHQDHIGNLNRIKYDSLYAGIFTTKKIRQGTTVNEPIYIDDGVRICIFPLPSTHSKGSVGLQVDKSIAFLGDAIYTEGKNGKQVYNVNTLKEMITCLENLKAASFALSHYENFIEPKEQVLSDLKKIYLQRKPGESYIRLN